MDTTATAIKHAEPMTAQDFLDTFEKRLAEVKAREPEGWMVGWDYGLFVQFGDDGQVRTMGYEWATMFDNPDAARRRPIWNGHHERAKVMQSATAQALAIESLESAIKTTKEAAERMAKA